MLTEKTVTYRGISEIWLELDGHEGALRGSDPFIGDPACLAARDAAHVARLADVVRYLVDA